MDDIVRDFYNRDADREWNRLAEPLQRVEFESTLRLVDRYFPATGKVCDIGSGPGRYAIELAQRGYRVSLLDVASQLLAKARHAFGVAGLTADAFIEGNARDLSGFPGGSFDAALLLGPLYHITDAAGRLQVLAELKRILRPGGVAIAAYLNTWGLIRTGIADFPDWYRQADTIRSLLSARSCSTNELAGFTAAYWSTPTDALREIASVGFEVITYAGAEGFCGGMSPMVAALAERDPEAYGNVVVVAAETCELPQYRDATDHLHVVIRRPRHAAGS